MNRPYIIKYISNFFNSKHNPDITSKIFVILEQYKINYTSNKNGMFINLNIIDDDILQILYDIIVSSINDIYINNIDIPTCQIKVTKSKLNGKTIKINDDIALTTVDSFILNLSRNMLSI
jgi:hypothetical protein|tara:strand:+ start:50 stop:409 length:360 start_codon:yes stop_codon:yes gene_type:complete